MTTQSPKKQLNELLVTICQVEPTWDRIITGLTIDSREVKPGDLYFAYPGKQADGRNYINAAIERGAAAIVAEADGAMPKMELRNGQGNRTVPIFAIPNVASQVGVIAAYFYDYPSKQMSVIGVTGTNGKTSCCQFIAASLQMANKACGVMGSLGRGLYGALQQTDLLNTPDAVTAQRVLAELRDSKAKYITMEVSSHGLVQERVNGIEIDIGVFTNLNRDHLDYHANMEEYAQAKRKLFAHPGLRYAVLNVDDPYGRQWSQELEGQLPVYTYSLSSNKIHRDLHMHVLHSVCNDEGITASIHTPWGDGVLHNPYLIGSFNLSNLLAVLNVLNILGIPLQNALAYLAELRGVPGRMESFGGGNLPLVVVDYAHKPDALEQVLNTLRQQCKGKLWCVFGCGGNRDRGKRPMMGKIAERYADRVIITDDNPRDEDRRDIIAEILTGLTRPQQAIVEHDRRRAIAHAIECAQAGDIVLVAGKGHENYQIIGKEKLPLSDGVEVQLCLSKK
jgi:UDP-N-acetylmuramoyl-L-alanyl-D-glutamate--2,6-diaminopimelate ligase